MEILQPVGWGQGLKGEAVPCTIPVFGIVSSGGFAGLRPGPILKPPCTFCTSCRDPFHVSVLKPGPPRLGWCWIKACTIQTGSGRVSRAQGGLNHFPLHSRFPNFPNPNDSRMNKTWRVPVVRRGWQEGHTDTGTEPS